jgi:hypothetical protein
MQQGEFFSYGPTKAKNCVVELIISDREANFGENDAKDRRFF